jgi:phage terminase large subunit-like protein
MSDVEFSDLLSELNKSANELNAGTEMVNSVLASVDPAHQDESRV